MFETAAEIELTVQTIYLSITAATFTFMDSVEIQALSLSRIRKVLSVEAGAGSVGMGTLT